MKYVNAYAEGENIVLLQRVTGHLKEQRVPAEYVSYIRKLDVTKRCRDVLKRNQQSGNLLHCKDAGDYLRLEWNHPYRRQEEHSRQGAFFESEVSTFEADVHPVRRFFSDNNVGIAEPRRVYLDIETDSRVPFAGALNGEAMVLCWVLVDDEGWTWTGVNNGSNEREILQSFWKALENYDQVVFWNNPMGGPGFDEVVMQKRSRRLGIKFNPKRWLWLDHCAAFKKYEIASAESGDEKLSFKLDAVATNLLGEGKHDVDASKTWELWQIDCKRLVDYCVQDTKLLARIEEKTGYLDLFQSICELTFCFPETRSIQPTVQMDGLLLRLGQQNGVHFPTKFFGEKTYTKALGAFVMKPVLGIHEDVYVADFGSLYPNIMITWNISPETKKAPSSAPNNTFPNAHLHSANHCITPTTGVEFRTDRVGILPLALTLLLDARAEFKAKGEVRKEKAAKIVANSFYGGMGTPYSRYYDREIVEATTQTGAWLIQTTMKEAGNGNIQVVYGDTDSVFLSKLSSKDFGDFIQCCNANTYPRHTESFGCRSCRLSLNHDKTFDRVIFTAGKRYAGAYKKGLELKTDIKGLEYKRGDTLKLARQLQKACIDEFVSGRLAVDIYRALVLTTRGIVLEAPFEVSDIQITKGISRPLEDYKVRPTKTGEDSAGSPHVRVAKLLMERGFQIGVGTRVSYVVVDATQQPMGVIPSCDFAGAFDRYHMWESEVYPPTMRLLQAMFPDEDWEQYLKVRPKKPRKKKELTQRDMFDEVA